MFSEDKIGDSIFNKETNPKIKIINEPITKRQKEQPLMLSDIKADKPLIVSLNEITKYKYFFIALHPFIFYGYRIHHNTKNCLISVFKIHNETLNIWTHLIATIFYIALPFFYYNNEKVFEFFKHKIISFYLISIIICYLFSSFYHIFNCHSRRISNLAFSLDIAGIILSLLAGVVSNQYFMFYFFPNARFFYNLFYVSLSLLILSINRMKNFTPGMLHKIRTFLIVILFATSYISYLHWTFVADIEEIIEMTPYMIVAFLPMFFGFAFYFSKFPESYFQNETVDLYLQSHSLWHFLVVISGYGYYITLFKYYNIIEIKILNN